MCNNRSCGSFVLMPCSAEWGNRGPYVGPGESTCITFYENMLVWTESFLILTPEVQDRQESAITACTVFTHENMPCPVPGRGQMCNDQANAAGSLLRVCRVGTASQSTKCQARVLVRECSSCCFPRFFQCPSRRACGTQPSSDLQVSHACVNFSFWKEVFLACSSWAVYWHTLPSRGCFWKAAAGILSGFPSAIASFADLPALCAARSVSDPLSLLPPSTCTSVSGGRASVGRGEENILLLVYEF